MQFHKNMFTTSLFILVVWMIITFYGEILQAGTGISLTELVSKQIIIALVLAPLFLLAVIVFLKWKDLGLNYPKSLRSLYVTWLPVLYIVIFLGITFVKGFPGTQIVITVLINALLVGMSEELMFRGIMFKSALSRFKIWQAIWITSIIFGAIHALNSFITGEINTAFAQALAATMSGIWFLAIRIRTGSLIPVILIHGLWDFSIFMMLYGSTANETTNASFSIQLLAQSLLILPLFLYGLYLLRGVGRDLDTSFENIR